MDQASDTAARVEALNKVFQFYYKANQTTLRKAGDFYAPIIFGRKKRLNFFSSEYIPLCLAMFLEGVRNSTAKMDGTPDEKSIAALKEKLLPRDYENAFNQYWAVIEEALEQTPSTPKALSEALSTAFMLRLFGDDTEEPHPEKISSARHQIAVDFQIGKMLYEFTRGSRIVLERLANPKFSEKDMENLKGVDSQKQPCASACEK